MPRRTVADIERFIADHFATAHDFARIEHLGEDGVRVRLKYKHEYLRPGNRISGPTLMALADTAMYYAVLAELGALRDTFTTSLDIHFLRGAEPRDVIAHARVLKLGRRLAVGTVELRSDGDPAVIAHATVTYNVPQELPA